MDMIERVARALFAVEWDSKSSDPWEGAYADEREAWLQSARAAIEAMRDPTDAMKDAGDLPTYQWVDDVASNVWGRMIDAALSEGSDATP
jgi:hypothetical protein